MALTFTETKRDVHGRSRVWQGQITFDTSYPTGGEAIAPGDFGLTRIDHVIVESSNVARLALWDSANSKIILGSSSTGTESTNASDQSSIVATVTVYGV